MELSPAVRAYYDRGGELIRLGAGAGRLEFLRTQDVLRRVLPPAPARVLDVGGATGVHAAWLVADGYDVRLVDPVPSHVAHASRSFDAVLGDARALDEPDASFDAVLLLGPLYHLLRREERVAALREAARVAVPGGLVAAATISRFAALHDTMSRGTYADPAVRARVHQSTRTGAHLPDRGSGLFTEAYFHHPDEVPAEFAAAGLPGAERYALEGAVWLLPDLEERLQRWEETNQALRLVERDPTLLGASSHLLTVAHRP